MPLHKDRDMKHNIKILSKIPLFMLLSQNRYSGSEFIMYIISTFFWYRILLVKIFGDITPTEVCLLIYRQDRRGNSKLIWLILYTKSVVFIVKKWNSDRDIGNLQELPQYKSCKYWNIGMYYKLKTLKKTSLHVQASSAWGRS